MRRLSFYGTPIVVGHFILAVWHLFVLSKLDPMLSTQLVLFVSAPAELPNLRAFRVAHHDLGAADRGCLSRRDRHCVVTSSQPP